LESIEIGFTVFAVIMGLFAILLFAFSFLAESRTRQNMYSGVSCIMGGRLAALFVIGQSYCSYSISLIAQITQTKGGKWVHDREFSSKDNWTEQNRIGYDLARLDLAFQTSFIGVLS